MNDEEKAWRDRYDNIMQDIANSNSMEERREKVIYYRNELATMRDSGLSVDNDLAYLGIGARVDTEENNVAPIESKNDAAPAEPVQQNQVGGEQVAAINTSDSYNPEVAWRDRYNNIIKDIQNGGTTRERLERIRYYTDNGELDAFRKSGIDVDNDLTYLHQERYKDIIQNMTNIAPGEERQKTYNYYQNEIDILRSWGLLKDLAPSVDKDLATLGLVKDKPLLQDIKDTVTNWKDGMAADETELKRAHASGNPNWLAAAQDASINNSPVLSANPVSGLIGVYKKTYKEVFGEELLTREEYGERVLEAYSNPTKFASVPTEIRAYKNKPIPDTFGDALKAGFKPDELCLRFAYNATVGPAVEIIGDIAHNGWTQSEFGKKWQEHPAAAVTEGTFATLQAVAPLELARPHAISLGEAGAAKLAKGAGKLGETIKNTDIYGGLEPALAGGGTLKSPLFDNSLKLADNILEFTIKKDSEFYRALVDDSGYIPPKTLSEIYKQQLQDKLTIKNEYKPYELNQHSQVLGKEMETAGMLKPADHYQAHHIFSIGDFSNRCFEVQKAAAFIKKTFDDCNMPYDCAANGVWLPGKSASRSFCTEKAAVHSGAPTDTYILKTAEILGDAEPKTAANIAAVAQKIREQLLSGKLEINDVKPKFELNGPIFTQSAVIGLTAKNNLRNQAGNDTQLPQGSIDAPGTTPANTQSPRMPQRAVSGGAAVLSAPSRNAIHNSGKDMDMTSQRLNTSLGTINSTLLPLSAAGLSLKKDNNEPSQENTAVSIPAEKSNVNIGTQLNFNEIAMIIREQEMEKAELEKQRQRYDDRPMTQEEAARKAKYDYTDGESDRLDTEKKCLHDEMGKLHADRGDIVKRAEDLGIYKYLPDFINRRINPLKAGEVRDFYTDEAKYNEECKDFRQRWAEHHTKSQAMEERINTPETREVISAMTDQYIKNDQERQAKLENAQTKIEALDKAMSKNIHDAVGTFIKQDGSDTFTSEQSVATWQRITGIMNVEPRPDIPGTEKLKLGEAREYSIQAKAIIEREGFWPGQAGDKEIAVKMYSMGYSRESVQLGIMQASSETTGITVSGQSRDYACGITTQVEAMGYTPALSRPGLQL